MRLLKRTRNRQLISKLILSVLAFNLWATLRAQPIESFSQIELKSGTQNYEITTSDEQVWKTRISIPRVDKTDTGKKYPLIIGLHWLATDKKDIDEAYVNFSQCLLEPVFTKLNTFIIAPQADEILWHSENNQIRVLTLIEQAKKHWPIDEKRIVVTGYSQGGVGSWYYADKYPVIFSAAIPVASSYPKIPSSTIDIPMYVIHSKNDETFPAKRIRSRIKEYRKKGTDITYVQNRLSHYRACDYKNYLQATTEWLQNEVWETKKPSMNDGLENKDNN